jgi:zinc/manganese transport system substrate-binding protein
VTRRIRFTRLPARSLPLPLPLAIALTLALPLAIALTLALGFAGCGSGAASPATGGGGSSTSTGGSLRVIAAENFWGNIASQLAGSRAGVRSIIVDPSADPHAYQPTASDARALATAKLVIVNGLGYDPWAPKLLAANQVSGRKVITVGGLLGLKEGDNPHRWYSPADVESVANAITGELKRLDPRDSAYFEQQRTAFETQGLARYHALIASIKSRYADVPVGASESIFALLSPALRLRLITPPSFMKATSEGTDVSARDNATTQGQISSRQLKVWIYNSQNATPGIQRLNALARSRGIPVATVTETLIPPSARFQDWQSAQLDGISRALHQATGR